MKGITQVSRELYDYEKDPAETTNAVNLPEYGEVVRSFEQIARVSQE